MNIKEIFDDILFWLIYPISILRDFENKHPIKHIFFVIVPISIIVSIITSLIILSQQY